MNVRRARRLVGLLALAATASACEAVLGLSDFDITSPDAAAPDGSLSSTSSSSSSGSIVSQPDGAIVEIPPDGASSDDAGTDDAGPVLDAAADLDAAREDASVACSSSVTCYAPEICCEPFPGFSGVCAKSCGTDSFTCDDDGDCPSGHVCCYQGNASVPNGSTCMTACSGSLMPTCTNKPCPAGDTCTTPIGPANLRTCK